MATLASFPPRFLSPLTSPSPSPSPSLSSTSLRRHLNHHHRHHVNQQHHHHHYGRRFGNSDLIPTCQDPCVVCLEGKCTVASQGCNHEFCTRCALYLCTMTCSSSATAKGPPGSLPCPLCRLGIVSFIKLPNTRPVPKDIPRTSSLSLSFCACSSSADQQQPQQQQQQQQQRPVSLTTPLCKPYELGSSFRSLSCQRFPSMKLNSSLCMGGGSESITPSIIVGSVHRSLRNHWSRCSRISVGRSSSHGEGRNKSSWLCSLNQYVATSNG